MQNTHVPLCFVNLMNIPVHLTTKTITGSLIPGDHKSCQTEVAVAEETEIKQ